MKAYQDLIRHILSKGQDRGDRTGVGTRGVFGYQMRFDLAEGFPLVTSKRTFFRGAAEELLWMLRGETNAKPLQEKGVQIWDEWADENGHLGPIYGMQWRDWAGPDTERVDQIDQLIDGLINNPFSRRHIVSAWNPAELPHEELAPHQNPSLGRMALAPCHTLFQFYVDTLPGGEQRLSCQLYQRSADVFLGVPFNIAGYALLTLLVAHRTGMVPGEFVHTFGDAHLYLNHLEQTEELLTRDPLPLPEVTLHHAPDTPLDRVSYDDIELINYRCHPPIKAPVAV